MTNHRESLIQEALRQGAEYSRKVEEEYETFWGSRFWDFTRKEKARWMLKWARRFGPRADRWNVLEVGCGIGWTSLYVAQRGTEVGRLVAVDSSPRAIEEALRLKDKVPFHVQDKVQFIQGTFYEHSGGPYHLIYMHEVFEHLPDPQAVFDKVSELILPGGCFMISTPNDDRLDNRIREMMGRAKEPLDLLHIKEYTFNELKGYRDKDWRCVKASARILWSPFVLAGIFGLGNKSLGRRFIPPARVLSNTRINYWLGAFFPRLGHELLFLFQKRARTENRPQQIS